MSAPYACFSKIIGLASTDCDCFTEDMPTDAGESASGLQLADLEGLTLDVIKAAATCATGGDGWTLMEKARTEGLKRYKSEVLKYIQTNAKWKRAPVVGPKRPTIGDKESARRAITMGSTYHGVSMKLAHHVGGLAHIKRIGTYFTTTGTVDVKLYAAGTVNDIDYDHTLVDTLTLDTEANVLKWNDVDLELSLEVDGALNPWFWLIYEPGALVALNSKVHCGCGGYDGPYDESKESAVKRDGKAWMPWVSMVGGTRGDDLDELETWARSNETHGLILDVEFTCDPLTAICNGYPDYDKDPIQMSAAWAVRYAAGSYIVSQILASTQVNRETLTGDGVNYYQLKGHFEKKFFEHAHDFIGASLVQPINSDEAGANVNTYSDCYTCKSKTGFSLSTILR